jgi:hypothetical protein
VDDCKPLTAGTLAVQANQDMLAAFFKTAKGLLAKEGEVHVAMQDDHARAAWNVRGIAAREKLTYRAALDFMPEEFPGYQHFRTLPHHTLVRRREGEDGEGAEEGEEGESIEAAEEDVAAGAKTLIFQVDREAKAEKRGHGGAVQVECS